MKHFFLPREGIVYTYVLSRTDIENGKKKVKVTDFLSFYSLPSHVMNNPKHNMLYVFMVRCRLAIRFTILQPRCHTSS